MTSGSERLRILELKKWRDVQSAPSKVLRGSAAQLGSFIYYSTSTSKTVFAYDTTSCKWSTLPDCPQQFFALAAVNERLTAVGGFRGLSPTGALQSFVIVDGAGSWEELLPPMPTKRGRAAAFCDAAGKNLIVAGGQLAVVGGRLGPGVTIRSSSPDVDEAGYVKSVEMLDTESEQWYTLASLPKATTDLSVTLCGGNLYLLGGCLSKNHTKTVLTCHLKTLLKTATILQSSSWSGPASTGMDAWQRIADVPVYASTSAVLFGTVLVAIGGYEESETPTDKIYSYDPSEDSWHVVGSMSKARYQAVAATLPGNHVMVVGGYDADYNGSDVTEIGSV